MKKQDYYPVTEKPYELKLGNKSYEIHTVVSKKHGFVGWMMGNPDQNVNVLCRDGANQPVNINQMTQEDVLSLVSDIRRIKVGKALALETILRRHKTLIT